MPRSNNMKYVRYHKVSGTEVAQRLSAPDRMTVQQLCQWLRCGKGTEDTHTLRDMVRRITPDLALAKGKSAKPTAFSSVTRGTYGQTEKIKYKLQSLKT